VVPICCMCDFRNFFRCSGVIGYEGIRIGEKSQNVAENWLRVGIEYYPVGEFRIHTIRCRLISDSGNLTRIFDCRVSFKESSFV
jgi:hypothetical protein